MNIRRSYHLGRFMLTANYEDKLEYIKNALKSKEPQKKGNYFWTFFKIEEKNTNIGTFFFGYLLKTLSITQEEIADFEKQEFFYENIKDKIKAKIRFFLHIESGIIAYHTLGSLISNNQFRNTFSKIIMEYYQNFFIHAEIQSINEEMEFLDAIKKFDKIYSFRISLHPSNPRNRDIWEKIDEKFKKYNIEKETRYIFGKHDDNGIMGLEDDEETKSSLFMALDGYGSAKVDGTIMDKDKSISSSNFQKKEIIIEEENEPLINILDKLLEFFTIIINKY